MTEAVYCNIIWNFHYISYTYYVFNSHTAKNTRGKLPLSVLAFSMKMEMKVGHNGEAEVHANYTKCVCF